jgi:fatty acid desaturase
MANRGAYNVAELATKQARSIVADLFERKAWIYWTDFLVSVTIGYGSATIFMEAKRLPVQIIAYLLAVAALYRVSLFMHEISHMRHDEMPIFKRTWNILAGIFMMIPSFFYETHREHHSSKHYGTEQDGEYLPLAQGTLWGLVLFMAQVLYLPILTFIRFLIITPVSFVFPGVRRWALKHWSSFVIDLKFERHIKKRDQLRTWAWLEFGCFLWACTILTLMFVGFKPWYYIFQIYGLAIGTLSLNHFRTLVAHRYRSDGNPMTHEDQLMDSTDIVGDPIFTEILCPVGLRFHALHHLFPGLPYHNLMTAHKRLMAQLPADSPYRQVVYPHVFAVLKELVQEIRENKRQGLPTRTISKNRQQAAA